MFDMHFLLMYNVFYAYILQERELVMTAAKKADTVRVHYTGKLTDGTVFDSSEGREPLEFKLGTGMVISGFESAIIGMSAGESKTATIPVDEAYGPRREEMVAEIPLDKFPIQEKVEVGQVLKMQNQDGEVLNLLVVNLTDSTITIDGNHPLSGQDLVFDIELVEVL